MPWADKLYGCDPRWWHQYDGIPEFKGEKWSTHDKHSSSNDKAEIGELYDVNLVKGATVDGAGFSYDPGVIHHGNNSGYQSINLAILLGSPYIVLVGFNMSHKNGRGHFFGAHPAPLFNQDAYENWLPQFDRGAKDLPKEITIINATPDSALTCFPKVPLEIAIENHSLHRHRS